MKIFADLHHGALSYSLHLLFEKRLGWELYNPIGMGWRDEGFWQYSQLHDTIHSYLNIKDSDKNKGSHYERFDKDFKWTQKYMSFGQFVEADIGAVLCSVGPHEDTFFDLIQRYKPNAKLIRQIGNWNEEVDFNKSKNVMISVGPFVCPDFVNYVCYHQEFDTKKWNYTKPTNFRTIKTFINCFKTSVNYELWPYFKKAMPEFTFKMHGIGGDEGIVSPQSKVCEAMKDSGFIWHIKLGGEGFGHVIHNAYAIGRPCIVKAKYYQGKMAEPLLIHGKTCIDLDQVSGSKAVEMIRYFSEPARFDKMSKNAYKRFCEVCDFDGEEKPLRKFLDNLK